MTITLALTAMLALFSAGSQVPQGTHTPMRNTFVVAAETVIDNASRVDLKADLAVSDAQMKQVDTARATLKAMVEDDREKEVAVTITDMVSQLSACRLQATNGVSTDACKAQFERARLRAMEAIGKHKSGDTWTDGPPAY